MIDFQALLLSCIFIAIAVAVAGVMEQQTKVDMSRGYNRNVPRYTDFQVFAASPIISLILMYAGYCIYKFFQFALTIL